MYFEELICFIVFWIDWEVLLLNNFVGFVFKGSIFILCV